MVFRNVKIYTKEKGENERLSKLCREKGREWAIRGERGREGGRGVREIP